MNVGDLQLERPSCVLIRGKGSKERMVPLTKDTAAVTKTLIRERGVTQDSQSPVFVNARGQRLTRHGVIHIIQRAVAIAARTHPPLSSKAISPHTLRHTAAMQLLQHGIDRSVIALWLGHESVETTQMYLHADLRLKEEALSRVTPLDVKPGRYRPDDKLLAFLESL